MIPHIGVREVHSKSEKVDRKEPQRAEVGFRERKGLMYKNIMRVK